MRISDWSSYVCSSDLQQEGGEPSLPAEVREEEGNHEADEQQERRVDAPALRLGIEAVKELAEAGPDEHPAGPARIARLPAVAHPVGVEDRPVEDRRYREIEKIEHRQCQAGVEPAREQVLAQPAEQADVGHRWRQKIGRAHV